MLTPYLEQTNVYNAIDLKLTMYQLTPHYGIQAPVAVKTFVPTFMCPSDSGAAVASNLYGIDGDLAPSNYAFCLGTGTTRGKTGWLGSPWDADGVFSAGAMPGGRLLLRMLTGEKEHTSPALSGPGSVVKFVPAKDDLKQLAATAAFSGLRLLKYDDPPCFVHDGIAMRETHIESFKA